LIITVPIAGEFYLHSLKHGYIDKVRAFPPIKKTPKPAVSGISPQQARKIDNNASDPGNRLINSIG
jgi:hypothetical protein